MNRPIIYFDSDGVLADFEAGVLAVTGIDLSMAGPDAFSDTGLKNQVFASPTFFIDLPMLPGAKDLVAYAMGFDADVKVLTATGFSNEEAIGKQKIQWYKEHFPEIKEVLLVPDSKSKERFAYPDIILIDDRLEKSIIPFRAKKGIGIHHVSNVQTKRELDQIFNEKSWEQVDRREYPRF